MKKTLLALLIPFALSGCFELPKLNKNASINQSKICLASNDEEASKCPSSELIYLRFTSADNLQRPLSAAALYCNYNYQVTLNSSGVICVMTQARLNMLGK